MSNGTKIGNHNQSIAEKSITQSGALAVQDAANSMRDMNTLLSTASGAALANFIESGDPKYLESLNTLNEQSKLAKNNFIDLFNSVSKSLNSES